MLNSYPHLTIRNHTYYARFSVPKHLTGIAKRKNFFYPQCIVKDTPALHPELFWIPLLALFLGCRLNELCQLDCADIQKHSGIYCLHISPDDRETMLKKKEVKRTKTKNTRIVPIPQKILDLGFLKYIWSQL